MCRFALYLGREISISSLLTDPAHSIIVQSSHSKEREEPLNGDGFGVAWYVDGADAPAIFRDLTPAWNNLNLLNLARVTRTRCLMAHVRAASPGLAVQQLNCHPFRRGRLAFMHNGGVAGFRKIRRDLLGKLSDEAFHSIGGTTDSEHVFGLVADRLDPSDSEYDLAEMRDALRFGISEVERLRNDANIEARSTLNLALTDGKRAVVSRYITGGGQGANSLYVHAGSRYVCEDGLCRMITDREDGAVIIASEPLSQDPGWDRVPTNHIVSVDGDLEVTIEPIAPL